MIKKYRFPPIALATPWLAVILSLLLPASALARPLNIIFVLVDDLRFDGMGFLQEELDTPHIDALASRGVYFPNAVVTTSLCSPSRATILTGQSTRNHGIVDNNNSSERGLVFFPAYLQASGYETGFFGKWHMGNATDAPRDGFDRWVSFAGQGFYYPVTRQDGRVNQINVDGTHVDQEGYITDEITDYLLDWLASGRDPSKPFFAYLSHKAVHSDAEPAPRHRGQYQHTRFELPETVTVTEEYERGKPMWVKNQRNSWHGIDFFYASDRKMADYLTDYYGALSAVDESLGRIWSYLEDTGLDDDTFVVFYSDNGFLIGDHGLIDKRNAYEGSVRVPMVVAAPGHLPEGVINDAMVRNLDLAPTFLDAADVEPPAHFEGKSFLPVASGELDLEAWGEPDFVYEYFWEWTFPMTPTTFAIQRGPLKYIQYHGVWDIEELYDVDADPLEVHNLIDEPDYYAARQALRTALYEQLGEEDGRPSVPFTARLAEGMNLRDEDGPVAAPFPDAWKDEPNRADRYLGLMPDTPEKKAHLDAGKPYMPWLMESEEEPRPNILLIVAEDMSARVGAFGDELARTPALDRLANQGIRYPNTFTTSGVCAPSRSTLMTGVHAISMGTQHMRTGHGIPGHFDTPYEAVPPPEVKAFPELLRRAGYATANLAKTDYQFGEPFTIWDLHAGDYLSAPDPTLWRDLRRDLPGERPFFAMLNLLVTHEGFLAIEDAQYPEPWNALVDQLIKARASQVEAVTDPASVDVPPYYPDTPSVRASIAQFYDNVHAMDKLVGEILTALEEDGLFDNTIVIWTTDHGDAFPRAKRAVYDSGIKVPMILRFPDGRGAGTVNESLVSFIDMAPTILGLAGAQVPGFIQGRDFLAGEAREFVFAARDRIDQIEDRVRAGRDARYKYIRNLRPELAYFRPVVFRDMFPIMRELWTGLEMGTLNATQGAYFKAPRPAEELYDTVDDPWEVNNLAGNSKHAEALARLRGAVDGWLDSVGDMGEMSELEMLGRMWPGLEQPVTAAPKITRERNLVWLSSSTEGASIGFSVDDGPWQLYTAPVALAPGESIAAKAVRYGYRESEVTRMDGS